MLAVAGLAFVFGGITCFRRSTENRLVVENRSGQNLIALQIVMPHSGQVITFKNIPDGGAESARFAIDGDDGFAVKGLLGDGTRLGGYVGYVTNGMYGVHPRFVILKGGRIDFTE